ncbi:hypothetical protein AHMF7605_16895 [Adhaeribacter arboris]|uniref:DUF4403 domain-containing protein n=1 Tax=Adhaeribacter arboris TaxID=2072846 RepID=A0A2T2YHT2_9BACT|nr:DUF4403 family protein [Adhaeribacter arboris]PSR55060.1 hypothetical protein AHMF7605_16895 [Adhaeribacter arboris]
MRFILNCFTFLSVLLTSTLLITSCQKTTTLQATAPTQSVAAAPAFERKLSTITVPISFQAATLETKLNQELNGILYKDDNLEGDNLAVTVSKIGKLGIRAEQNKIYFTVPLHIFAKGRWKWEPCKICPVIDKSESTEFDVVVKTESLLSFTEDYKVKTVTTGDFDWGATKPTLTVGPLKIGLARFVEPAMQNQMARLSNMLDQEIQKRLNIRQYVQEAWLKLQQPIQLDKTYNAWLTVTPQDIRISPLQATNGELNLRIGFNSFIETVTNGKPQVKVNPNLPKLITDNRLIDNVQIGLIGEVPYLHATKLLQEQVAGKTYNFENGKQQITINNAEISGSGDKLVVMLDVNGKAKTGLFTKKIVGKVFLKAIPYYDAATTSIRIREVDYDLKTKDQLLKTASWLAKGKFIRNIQEQITFPVKTQLEQARTLLQHSLDQSAHVNDAILLKGNIRSFTPDNIYLTPTSIKAVVNAQGNLTVQIVKL